MAAFSQVLAESFSLPELKAFQIDILTPDRIHTYEDIGVELSDGAFEAVCLDEAKDAFAGPGFALRAYSPERSDLDFVVSLDAESGATLIAAEGSIGRLSRVAAGIDRLLSSEPEALEPEPENEVPAEIGIFEALAAVRSEKV